MSSACGTWAGVVLLVSVPLFVLRVGGAAVDRLPRTMLRDRLTMRQSWATMSTGTSRHGGSTCGSACSQRKNIVPTRCPLLSSQFG